MTRGELIRQKRLEAGLTQEELANLLGIKKSSISRYESGQVDKIHREIAQKMAQILQVDFKYLVQNRPIKDLDFEKNYLYMERPRSHPFGMRPDAQISVSELQKLVATHPVFLFDTVSDYLQGNHLKILEVNDLEPGNYYALKAMPFFSRFGFKRKQLVFTPDDTLRDNERQLVMLDGKPYYGKVRLYEGVALIKTELDEPDDLIFFNPSRDAYEVLGTLAKVHGH